MSPRKLNPALCAKRGHLWKVASRSRDTVQDFCARCPERRTRPPTPEEKRAFNTWMKKFEKPAPIHKLAHEVVKALGKEKGYEAMGVMDRLAAKNPKRVLTVGVDDSHYSSSSLTFVTHEAASDGGDPFNPRQKSEPVWHGVSVYYIPQCTGEDPIQFFLYPRDLDGVLKALQTLKKRMLTFPKVRREQRQSAQHRREKKRKAPTHPSELRGKARREAYEASGGPDDDR